MATAGDLPKGENVYFSDPESGGEMARLLSQDRLITKGMGGLFSERSDLPESIASSMRLAALVVGLWRWPLLILRSRWWGSMLAKR